MREIPLRDEYDVVVVGAGPAGMAAASLCARGGLATALFDAQAAPGGSAWRAVTATPLTDRAVLGEEYWKGEPLARQFLASEARYVPLAMVTAVGTGREVDVSIEGHPRRLSATYVVLATGAVERPFEVPGGALAGVTSVGFSHAQLVDEGRVPQGRVVLAGSGPLLWLHARRLLAAGARVEALLDTTPLANRREALRHVAGFAFSPYRGPALRVQRQVRSRIPVHFGASQLRAEGGGGRVERVLWRDTRQGERALAADTLVLHHGTVPDLALARSAGIELAWHPAQRCQVARVSPFGATSVAGIYAAGDVTGLIGAAGAGWQGTICGADIVHVVRPELAKPAARLARTALNRYLRGRPFVDAWFRPPEALVTR